MVLIECSNIECATLPSILAMVNFQFIHFFWIPLDTFMVKIHAVYFHMLMLERFDEIPLFRCIKRLSTISLSINVNWLLFESIVAPSKSF